MPAGKLAQISSGLPGGKEAVSCPAVEWAAWYVKREERQRTHEQSCLTAYPILTRQLRFYKVVTLILVAYYFSLMTIQQAWPMTIGPYATWEECASVREYLDRRGYETADCMQMPYPQPDSLLLQVIDVP